MDFHTYQREAKKTARAETRNVYYCALGLGGETGELLEQFKKSWRDDDKVITPVRRMKIVKEAGDVLWYLARLCDECGISLDDVACVNLNKLARRHAEGKITGEGSDR